MTLILIRDDDCNATTAPSLLEATYAPLLEQDFTLAFSAIPLVDLATLGPDHLPERYLVRDASSVQRGEVPLDEGRPMGEWLRTHSHHIVFQHGTTHARVRGETEFGSLSAREALDRLDCGRRVLAQALGRTPDGFVAPWDRLSSGSMVAALCRYRVVSTSWVSPSTLPVRAWPSHVHERVLQSNVIRTSDSVILRHDGGWLTPHTPVHMVEPMLNHFASGREVCTIVLHHWMFPPANGPHPVIRELARALRHMRVCTREDLHNLPRPGNIPVLNPHPAIRGSAA